MSAMKIIEDNDLETIQEEVFVQQATKKNLTVPLEYLPITLITGGKFTAPKVVYVRSFSVEEVISLSVSKEIYKLKNLIKVLQGMIWNPDNSIVISEWTEEQVSELLLKLYANFYGTKKESLLFPVSEEDITWMKEHDTELYERYERKAFVPTFTVDITTLNIKPIPKNLPDTIEITHNDCIYFFRIPRIIDTVTLDSIMQRKFYASDLRYQSLLRRIEKEQFDLISPDDFTFLNEYPVDKSLFLTKLTKIFMLEKIQEPNAPEKNFSVLEIEERLAQVSLLNLPPQVFKAYKEQLDAIQYGIDPVLTIINPITHKECTRRFSFRPLELVTLILFSIDNAKLGVSE